MDKTDALLLAGLCTVGAAGLGLAHYAARVEPERLGYARPRLAKAPPVKAVFFADLHIGPKYPPRHLQKVVDAINAQRPDLVLFGGDFYAKFIKDAPTLPHGWLAAQLARIEAPLGKYAVLGNHDVRDGAKPFFEQLFLAGGFTILWDEISTPAPGVSICGLAPYSDGRVMHKLPGEGWRVCLCHMPDKCRYLPLQTTDLVLAGHSHNGQVRLPVLTKMILPPGGKLYPYGSYWPAGRGAAQLFVSAGLGMSGVPFRFCAPPELVVLE